VDVIRHDDKGVECEAALVSIAEKSGDHKLCVFGALEDAVTLIRENRDGVSFALLTDCGHVKEAYPRG
jgi:hypothetical protein